MSEAGTRPLSAVEGQPQARETLAALARGGLHPPLLLFGPEGCGKRTAALAYAAALVCHQTDGVDACGECAGCRRVATAEAVTRMREGTSARDAPMTYPDVGVISIPARKTRISILQSRDIVQSLISRPFELERRVYIVDPADRMTSEAANALLKVLEEPPSYGALVLVTSAPWSLPVTVRSRLRAIRFRPLNEKLIERLLTSQGVAPAEAADRAALARGSVSRALELDPEDERSRVQTWLRVLEALARGDAAAPLAVAAAEELAGDPAQARAALALLLDLLRDVAVAASGGNSDLLDPEEVEPLAAAAPQLLGVALDRPRLVERIDAEIVIFNRNPRLAIEGAVLALGGLIDMRDLGGWSR